MTDDELSDLLTRTLQERAADAPDRAAIRSRLSTSAPRSSRLVRWPGAPLSAAAAVLAVVGGVALARPTLSDGPVPPGVSESSSRPSSVDGARSAGTRLVTVYDVVSPPQWKGEPKWQLDRQQLEVTSTGSPAYDAVAALVETPREVDGDPSWFTMVDGRPAAQVTSVNVASDVITVDVDRSLRDPYPQIDCECPTGEALIQAIAWTAQDAAGVELPVRLTVGDRPARWLAMSRIPASTFPDPAYLQREAKTGWYGQVCGGLNIYATTSSGTVATSAGAPAFDRIRAWLRVKVHVGQAVTLEFIGQCGDQVAVRLGRTEIVHRVGDLRFLARRPGTARLILWRPVCRFDADRTCRGGVASVGSVEVRVGQD